MDAKSIKKLKKFFAFGKKDKKLMMKKLMIIQKLRDLLNKVKTKVHSKKKFKKYFIKNTQVNSHGQL